MIARANDTVFGLASYFYTNDYARIIRVAEGLDYGLDGRHDSAAIPMKSPSVALRRVVLGREGGKEGMDEYMEIKSIVVNWLAVSSPLECGPRGGWRRPSGVAATTPVAAACWV